MSIENEALPAPIIIKRKKVYAAEEHHGGAWKVAYADFVTAMMAFFLLMWLLNATTEDQRKGLADYFNPSIPISRISGGGSDGLNGSSIFTEETFASMGTGASSRKSVVSRNEAEPAPDSEPADVAGQIERMQLAIAQSDSALSEHLIVKYSPEGIVIELVDSDDMPLFELSSSRSTGLLETLLSAISMSLDSFDNRLKIIGHTDARPFDPSQASNNWTLSADRADTARQLLLARGIARDRIVEISGKADTDLLVKADPLAAQNRRVSIIIITNAQPAL